MFRIPAYLRRASDALQALLDHAARVVELLATYVELRAQGGGADGRVDQLETRIARIEAEVDATLTKAETRFRAARAAEERARGMEKRAAEAQQSLELDEESLEDLPPEYRRLLEGGNGGGGPEERVQPMRESVAHPPGKEEVKRNLKRLKWGS